MRRLPDPDLSFRDSIDYILDCPLCRSALADPHPKDFALLVRDTAQFIHRLALSCHLPEFTDHGLPHLCSLLERISVWTTSGSHGGSEPIVERLNPEECAALLLAVLFHDIGMLSQRPDDLPQPAPIWALKSLTDVPNWVRTTHISRIRGVATRGLAGRSGTQPTDASVSRAYAIAEAHGSWPWQTPFTSLSPRDGALAAILAVADLLDEDSNRCDIATLLNHRQGTLLNRAHWIRHGLTAGRVNISKDVIEVTLASIPGTSAVLMGPVFAALRNHFCLASFYGVALTPIGAQNLKPRFNFPTGVPTTANSALTGWNRVPSFATETALSFQLLSTFFPIALLDDETCTRDELAEATSLLETVDLATFRRIRGNGEARSEFEQVAHSLLL